LIWSTFKSLKFHSYKCSHHFKIPCTLRSTTTTGSHIAYYPATVAGFQNSKTPKTVQTLRENQLVCSVPLLFNSSWHFSNHSAQWVEAVNPEVREAHECRVTPISIDIQESAVVSTMMQLEFQCFQTDHSETDDTVSCKQQLRWVGDFTVQTGTTQITWL